MVGAALVALATSASSHEGGSVTPETIVSWDGTIEMWIGNKYDQDASYRIEVLTKEGEVVPEDQWRSSLPGDEVTLLPTETINFYVQTKEKGKYYVCTTLVAEDGVASRICSRHWHR